MRSRAFKDALDGEFAVLGEALANPHRLELLGLLAQGERSVEELAESPQDVEVVAYRRGPYSDQAVTLLLEQGFKARRLSEGFPEWRAVRSRWSKWRTDLRERKPRHNDSKAE